MDPGQYREQYEKELASAAEQAPSGYRAVLKSAIPEAEGLDYAPRSLHSLEAT